MSAVVDREVFSPGLSEAVFERLYVDNNPGPEGLMADWRLNAAFLDGLTSISMVGTHL